MNQDKTELLSFLDNAFQKVGVPNFEFLYLQADLRGFGRYLQAFSDKNALFGAILAPLRSEKHTLIIPTFTYTAAGRFDCLATPTRVGSLNQWFLQQADECKRSEHPLFSVGALGAQNKIVENIGKDAFGSGSIYERLLTRSAAILHIGRPVSLGNTMVHHVEQKLGAVYRVHKSFPTLVYRGPQYVGTNYTAFVRRLDVPGHHFITETERSAALLHKAGLVKEVVMDVPTTNISLYPYVDTVAFYTNLFKADPNIFIEKPLQL